MTDDAFQLYPVIAQIAATFAGFGSVASGIGQRRGGDDTRVDAYRLKLMLFASLSATILGLLPATLAGLSFGTTRALSLSAVAGVVALAINLPLSTIRIVRIRHVEGFNLIAGIANAACALVAFVAFVFCVAQMPPNRVANLYLVGLMGLLGSSVIMFSRVIVSILRPHSEVADNDG